MYFQNCNLKIEKIEEVTQFTPGVIAAIAVPIAVVGLAIISIIAFCLHKKRKKVDQDHMEINERTKVDPFTENQAAKKALSKVMLVF